MEWVNPRYGFLGEANTRIIFKDRDGNVQRMLFTKLRGTIKKPKQNVFWKKHLNAC